jgi:hypothetical protein
MERVGRRVLRPLRRTVERAATKTFLTLDRVGVHLLPKHYYSSVPDHALLRRRTEWRAPVEITGVRWNLDEQLRWLEAACAPYLREVAGFAAYSRLAGEGLGPGFGAIESHVLHCVVRTRRPRRVVEVGSGVTTAIIAEAAAANEREGAPAAEIVSIDPFPRAALIARRISELVREYGHAVAADVFNALSDGDLLFIDSTHTVKTGSETLRLYLEVIPSLPPGVLVHVHDVTLPYLYGRDFGASLFDWQETSLVLALLCGNDRLQVRCCESALHYRRRDELRQLLPDYRPQNDRDGLRALGGDHFPSSLWLETVAADR